MKYIYFSKIMGAVRLSRYLIACNNTTGKAMTLYRKNLHLSQELFTVISCFEVALRNTVDSHYKSILGNDWLKVAAAKGGRFDNNNSRLTQTNINDSIYKLKNSYTHDKLVAELGFGGICLPINSFG